MSRSHINLIPFHGNALIKVSSIVTATIVGLLLHAPWAQAAPVFPSSIAGLRLRLEADFGVTPGGTFTWADQSGNGFNATQSTATRQPSLLTNASANGLYPAVSFDGVRNSTNGDVLSSTAQLQSPISAGMTTFVVWRPFLNTGEEMAFIAGGTQTAGSRRGLYIANSAIPLTPGFAGWAGGDLSNKYSVTAGQPYIATFSVSDARNTVSMWSHANGNALATPAVGSPFAESGLTDPAAGYTVGGTIDPNNGLYSYKGDISAILVYTGQISDSDRLIIDQYLYDKYFAVPVPEPSTFALLGLGIAGLAVKARRRRTA